MLHVYVYDGPGAGPRSVKSTVESLRRALKPQVHVHTITPERLLGRAWRASCLALVMPGGADLPYCKLLNGQGNDAIREYVQDQGGAYLGLCAGAYYACGRVEFEPETPLEVMGDRELAFFPGIARGAIVPGFDYRTETGAAAVALEAVAGGGEGDAAFWDYSNGGPAFLIGVLPDSVAEGAGLGSVATEATDSGVATATGREALNAQELMPGIRVLARYSKLPGRPAAALHCTVGKGHAVLCGTHPELAPHWLSPPELETVPSQRGLTAAAEPGPMGAGSAYDAHIVAMQRRLESTAAARWAFWLTLLRCAGLGSWLLEEVAPGGHATIASL